MDTTTLSLDLPLDELLECGAVAGRLVVPDEHAAVGTVHLSADGRRRTWRATGPGASIELAGGDDRRVYTLLLPSRLLNAASFVAGDSGTVTVAVGTHGGRPAAELRGPGGSATVSTHHDQFPLDHPLLKPIDTVATASVDAEALHTAVALAMQVPLGFEPKHTGWPVMSLAVGHGVIAITVDWWAYGTTRHTVPAETRGEARAVIRPPALDALLDVHPGGELVVGVNPRPDQPFELSSAGWTARLPQVDDDDDWPARVEDVLLDTFGPDAADPRGGGVYTLSSDPVVLGRLSAAPPRLEIASTVLVDVDSSPELLSELNDHNRNLGIARVSLHNRTISIHADLLAGSLDAAELRTTADWVAHQATRLAPVLATVFGGTDPNRHHEGSR